MLEQPQQPEPTPQVYLNKVERIATSVKAGYKTSEFWLHAIVQALTWYANANASTPKGHFAFAALSVLSLLGYTASRAYVKK